MLTGIGGPEQKIPKQIKHWGKARAKNNNVSNTIIGSMSRRSPLPEIYQANLDTLDNHAPKRSETVCKYFLPHEVVDKRITNGMPANEFTDARDETVKRSMGSSLWERRHFR